MRRGGAAWGPHIKGPVAIALGAAATLALPALALGESGAVAGMLTLTWTAGTVLIRRRWYTVYGAIVVVATPAMLLLPPLSVLAAAATLTVAAVALALWPGAPGDPASPGRWTRAGGGALIGAGIGRSDASRPRSRLLPGGRSSR